MAESRGELPKTLSDLYPVNADLALARYAALYSEFCEIFGSACTHFARAPGRVNLIGEHIDYHGYGVLPMALQLDCVLAFRPASNGKAALRLSRLNTISPGQVASFSVAREDQPEAIEGEVAWWHYLQSGLHAALAVAPDVAFAGADILLHSTIPAGAGVSSSSALVVAAALAFLAAANCTVGGMLRSASETVFHVRCRCLCQSLLTPVESASSSLVL